jgi:hypothetical protein
MHGPSLALFATIVLHRLDPAKLAQRRMACFLRLHASLSILLGLHFDVRAHLVVHPCVELFLVKRRAESKSKFVEQFMDFVSPFSFVSQRHHRIDFGRAAGGNVAREKRDNSQEKRDKDKGGGIGGGDAKEERGKKPSQGECADQSDADSNEG